MNALEILQQPEINSKLTAAILPVLRDRNLAPIHIASESQEFARVIGLIKPTDLAQISKDEIVRVAISSVSTGLSWSEQEGNFYLTTRNHKIIIPGNPPKEVTEKRLELSITHRGEITLRQRQGIIKMIDGPHCVYDGDTITSLNPAKNMLEHQKAFPPKQNARVMAVYCFVVMPDDTRLLRFYDQNDFDRWSGYSAKQNGSAGANKLYTSGPGGGIDPGFAMAKCIKHGLKSLPKCKTFGIPIKQEEDDELPYQRVFDADHEVMPSDTTPDHVGEAIPEQKEEEQLF